MFADWSSADYFSNISALVLFVITLRLGKKQAQTIEKVGTLSENSAAMLETVKELTTRVHSLSASVVSLQIREKIGVVKQRAGEAEANEWAANILLHDTCSVLDAYPHADANLREEYISVLELAFSAYCKECIAVGRIRRAELASTLVRKAKYFHGIYGSEVSVPLMKSIVKYAILLRGENGLPFDYKDVPSENLETEMAQKLPELEEPVLFNLIATEFPEVAIQVTLVATADESQPCLPGVESHDSEESDSEPESSADSFIATKVVRRPASRGYKFRSGSFFQVQRQKFGPAIRNRSPKSGRNTNI